MIKIGIELNGVVRNINKQIIKYYAKDIDPLFDDTDLDYNVYNIIPKLQFKSKSDLKKFIYEDYPYELFGCAAPMSRNLHTFINGWSHELCDDNGEYEVSFFSLYEEELSIQSTYFYLSKSGSRVRNVVFPKTIKDVFDKFDIIITDNPNILNYGKIRNKVIVNIIKNDNDTNTYADLTYSNIEELMKDNENFILEINKLLNKNTFYNCLKIKIKKFFRKWKIRK